MRILGRGAKARHIGALLAGVAFSACGAGQALAQDNAAPANTQANAPAPDNNSTTGDDIIVTAQRREQRLQDVPIAVTAISAEQAERQGVRTVDDIQVATPALSITRVNQTPLFYLRGVGTANQLPNEEPSIPLYVDGFYASTGAGSALSLNNIERLEVLRGPQGTLFGRNGTGGLINIITRTPSPDTHATLSAGFGNYDTISADFYGTTGLGSGGSAADLAIHYVNRLNGFGTNVNNGTDVGVDREFAARTKWLLEITPRTRVTLTGEYSNIRSDYGMTTQPLPGVLAFDGVTRRAGPQDVTWNFNPIATPRTWATTARIDQDLGFANLVNMTQYRANRTEYLKDVDQTPVNRGTADQEEYTKLFTEEIQLQSHPSSRAQWVAGLFYLSSSGGVDPLIIGGTQFGPTIASQIRYGNVDTTSYAAFAQITYPILDNLNITLGGRYTHDHKVLTGHVFNNLPSGGTTTVIASAAAANATPVLNSGKFTYRAALDYHITSDILLYGVYSRGYKAGSFNVLALADPPVRPETLDAIEGGFKTDWLDHHLRINIAAYHYNYHDIQLSQLFSAAAGGTGGIKILNATSAEIYGGEIETIIHPFTGFTLSANLAYTHGRYGTFLGAPFSHPQPFTCATGLPVGAAFGINAQCTGDASGHNVVRTTPFTSTITAIYEVPIGRNGLSLSASWYHNDGFFWEVDNRLAQPAYNLVNADIVYHVGERWSARLWTRNLFNEQYAVAETTSNNDDVAPGAPRTYGVTFTVNF